MLVWPDLVYTEMICMVALTALMLVWALALQAPLEEPASSVKTPNPSKAPWYFLGLQEMLVYLRSVVRRRRAPEHRRVRPHGDSVLSISTKRPATATTRSKQRKFSYIVFQIGFFELWIVLIILGTFLRGPNWNFFGPFEYWDAHKVLAQQQRRPLAILLGRHARPSECRRRRPAAERAWRFLYILWSAKAPASF